MSANHKLVASVSRGEAIVACPRCPVDSDGEGVAVVGGGRDERGSYPILDGWRCERGHTLTDLNHAQEATILESAVEYIGEAIEAMRDAHWDARIDSYRDDSDGFDY